MSNLTEQEKTDLASKALSLLTPIMDQYELEFTPNNRAAMIAAMQAGMKLATDEFRKIEL